MVIAIRLASFYLENGCFMPLFYYEIDLSKSRARCGRSSWDFVHHKKIRAESLMQFA